MFDPQLPPIHAGERPSASAETYLRELAARRIDGFESDGSGVRPGARSGGLRIDLYEVTADPAQDTDSKEWYVMGKLVGIRWVTVDGYGHYAADANKGDAGAVMRARLIAAETEVALWVPTQTRESHDEPASKPSVKTLDRVNVMMWQGLRIVVGGIGGSDKPRLVTGYATADVDPGDSGPFYIDGVTVKQDKGTTPMGIDPNTGVLQIARPWVWKWDNGGLICAALDESATSAPFYFAIQAACSVR